MANYRILYEKGVEIHRQPDGHWYYSSAAGEDRPVNEISPAGVQSVLGLRPIVLEAVAGAMHGITLLLPGEENIDEILMSDGPAFFTLPPDRWFDIRIQELFGKMLEANIRTTSAEKVTYILKAVSYHCKELAKSYSLICRDFKNMPHSPSENESDKVFFSANYSPWFEFDALVTAVRRAYDSTSPILWSTFGDKVNCPGSFYETYPKCRRLPHNLKERLERSWKEDGVKITSYRNNVQHYATLDFGMASAEMTKLDDVLWTTQVFIPDNPAAKARDKFEFNNRQDALSYGWRISCEVLDVTSAIVGDVEKQQALV